MVVKHSTFAQWVWSLGLVWGWEFYSPKPVARSGLGKEEGNRLLSWTYQALALGMGRVSLLPHPPGADQGSVDEVSKASSNPPPSPPHRGVG